jgi:hypothetical protein
MALDEVAGQPWSRKHDAKPVVAAAARTVYPASLEDLIEICSTHHPGERLHAAGSHWALSGAVISDETFVETHDPADGSHTALGRTLYDVVPKCLSTGFYNALRFESVPPFDDKTFAEGSGLYPVHVESGKRIYQLYAELDWGDVDDDSLAKRLADDGNEDYLGAWAFRTLGGAGGQTIAGAVSTGTHGGDFRLAPIADDVLAIHLVVDGGKHYWIERHPGTLGVDMTDDAKLEALYGATKYGGPTNFEIVRDKSFFEAVLVAAGRFGIIYSLVIGAVRQYCLHEDRKLTTWEKIKGDINNPKSPLWAGGGSADRFLQVAISVTPHNNQSAHLAGVTKRWNVPLAPDGTGEPIGRAERRGKRLAYDETLQAHPFERAGASHVFKPGGEVSLLQKACAAPDFMVTVLELVHDEIDEFVKSNGTKVGVGLGAVVGGAVASGAGFLVALLAALAILVVILASLIALLIDQIESGDGSLGAVLADIQSKLFDTAVNPVALAAAMVVWQDIVYHAFSSEQKDQAYTAISYAVMDIHDYMDKHCSVNPDSIEVFFEAADPMLIAYVDNLLSFEIAQENQKAQALVGYISLRFTGPTEALLGPQFFEPTCAVEVAGMQAIKGTTQFIDHALALALDPNFNAAVHWGQRNPATRAQIQRRFGDAPSRPTAGPLGYWRKVLKVLTANGRLDAFSNAFSIQTGLEIATPLIATLKADGGAKQIHVTWDARDNPPWTSMTLTITGPGAPLVSTHEPLKYTKDIPVPAGQYAVTLAATIDFGGEARETSKTVGVVVT